MRLFSILAFLVRMVRRIDLPPSPTYHGTPTMHRRNFLHLTAGAATALAFDPLARAAAQAKTLVAYPDPAVEIVDPRFAKYRVGNAAVERLYTARAEPKRSM